MGVILASSFSRGKRARGLYGLYAIANNSGAPFFYGQNKRLLRKDRHRHLGTEVKELLCREIGMREGDKNNSLCIEKVRQKPSPIWHFKATLIGAGWMFAGMYDRVIIITPAESSKQMADFTGLRTGNILIRYRVGRLQAGAALEGEIVLEADRADDFCRELSELL